MIGLVALSETLNKMAAVRWKRPPAVPVENTVVPRTPSVMRRLVSVDDKAPMKSLPLLPLLTLLLKLPSLAQVTLKSRPSVKLLLPLPTLMTPLSAPMSQDLQ